MDQKEPTSLLGANQLPAEEQMVNADEQLATAIDDQINSEEQGGVLGSALVQEVQDKYQKSKRKREGDEKRWLRAYQNYRGLYSKNVRFNEHEKSRVFVKVTKTKVQAAYGSVLDVLFSSGKFPLSIKETDVPEGAARLVHLTKQQQPEVIQPEAPAPERNPFDVGFQGDGFDVLPGDTFSSVTQGLDKRLKDTEKLKEGPSLEDGPQLKPARESAKRMERLILDQIAESHGKAELRKSVFEACLLGSGCIKGPFTFEKTLHRWELNEDGTRSYKPEKVKVPRIEHVSIWDIFPDASATCIQDSEHIIQRHKLSRSKLRGLKDFPFFDTKVINEVLSTTPNYVNEDYENQIMNENDNVETNIERYEVLEYWGIVDKKKLQDAGIQLGEEYSNLEEVQVNIWTCCNKIMRLVTNPFTPKRIPYLTFDYESNPYSFFGVGVAENMDDSQQIMNGHARMAIDNLALAGNLVFDVDEGALAPGQSMEVYPGKIFKRMSGQPGQAVYGVKFPSTAVENMQMFDKFRQIADESTGIPSYAHGQTGITATTRTASGMSMLMGAASLNVKTVIKNIDDDLLQPLGEAFFQWNMAFYPGELDIVGDLEVKAGGTASLMQKEVKSQRLTAFGQLLQNQALAPFVRIPAYVKAFVESLDLDPDELVNDADQAAVYAEIIGAAGGLGAGAAVPGIQNGQVGAVPAPPMPGDEAFSGTDQATGEQIGPS